MTVWPPRELFRSMTEPEIMAIDVETDFNGGVLEIAVVNDDGLLFGCPINPGYPTGDRFAHKGLSDALLSRALPVDVVYPLICKIVRDSYLVSWNAAYDRKHLGPIVSSSSRFLDCMLRFDPYRGHYVCDYGGYHRTKLVDAMRLIGLEYEDPGAHRAAPDAKAALAVWRWMQNNPIQMPGIPNGLAPSEHTRIRRLL